ncbi:Hypothetical protein POVR1_LOCUS165 [uncultured virus]|nr:Hypothetical protein POVR1_LOCUS165 [uncultured virus]
MDAQTEKVKKKGIKISPRSKPERSRQKAGQETHDEILSDGMIVDYPLLDDTIIHNFRRSSDDRISREKKGSSSILKFLSSGRRTKKHENPASSKLDTILKTHQPVGITTITHHHEKIKVMSFEVYNCGLLVYASSVTMMYEDDITVMIESHETNILINVTSQSLPENVCFFDCITNYHLYNSREEASRCFETILKTLLDENNFYAVYHYLIINTLCIGGEILNYSKKSQHVTFHLKELDKYTNYAIEAIGREIEYMIPLIRNKISLL